METMEAVTIAEIVTKDIRSASVFRKYGIDFCCGGKKSISQVCREKNINQSALETDLSRSAHGQAPIAANADQWTLSFLSNYIVEIHHGYVKRIIPDLLAWSKKVASVHGHSHPETIEIYGLFNSVADELKMHMVKEEQVLFPYVRQLEEAENTAAAAPAAGFGSVRNPISMMEDEHEYVGELIMKIQKLSNNYMPPADACNTFRALYAALNEFADDLFLHIHLENNVLFPKAELLEKELRA